jgi:splicing factor 3A subunit 3
VEQEDLDARIKEEPHVYFTGEEALGRFLDLHELHNMYINSKFGPKTKDGDEEELEYMRYLDTFSQVENIPRHFKFSK